MDNIKQLIDELRNELNENNYKYYVLNAPTMSDKEFDDKMALLEQLENDNPQYFDPNSPTQRVGSDINKAFRQVAHQRPMLSLANTYSVDEVADFFNRVKNALGNEPFQIVGEMKFDGTSISITYENGRMVQAVTRGDGIHGDDVTDNVRTIRCIPLQLRPGSGYPEHFEVRGEILMPWNVFDDLNKEREYNEEPLFANPRNAAAGTLKMQNSAEVARRKLDAYLYYLLGNNLPYDNHYDNLMAMKQWGFKVSSATKLLNNIEEVEQFIAYWDTERKHLPVATDGLVFKVNSAATAQPRLHCQESSVGNSL